MFIDDEDVTGFYEPSLAAGASRSGYCDTGSELVKDD